MWYISADDLSCSVNAVTYLDKACSGKQTCEYFAVDKDLALTKPCPGHQSFLEVQYDCINGRPMYLIYYCLLEEHWYYMKIPFNMLVIFRMFVYLILKMWKIFFSVAKIPASHHCSETSSIPLVAQHGYISSKFSSQNGWGNQKCPWRINGVPGQTIAISIIDFHPLSGQQTCKPLG